MQLVLCVCVCGLGGGGWGWGDLKVLRKMLNEV